jgi:hypothetical protein
LLLLAVAVAAVAGIVYAILPKSIQDKIKAALGGFIEGIEMNTGPLSEMSTGLKIAYLVAQL